MSVHQFQHTRMRHLRPAELGVVFIVSTVSSSLKKARADDREAWRTEHVVRAVVLSQASWQSKTFNIFSSM